LAGRYKKAALKAANGQFFWPNGMRLIVTISAVEKKISIDNKSGASNHNA